MPRYSEEFKFSILSKMMPPENQSVTTVARENGLSEGTLHKWKRKAKEKGLVIPGSKPSTERWSTQDKFHIVLETASLNEAEQAEYCREKGLYIEQIESWRNACMQANGGLAQESARLQRELRQKDREFKKLEKELLRKESALAETAALLVLRKNIQAIWGPKEDE